MLTLFCLDGIIWVRQKQGKFYGPESFAYSGEDDEVC